MLLRLTTFILVLTALGTGAMAQTTPSPSPTPKPQPRRPGLDQFGLSSGVFSRSSAGLNGSGTEAEPVTKEVVDADTFDTMMVVIEKSEFMEAELRRVLIAEPGVDMSAGSQFTKYFVHQVVGLMHVSSVQRDGRFGAPGIRSGQISRLLEGNEGVAHDISAVLSTNSLQYARYPARFDAISEKYGVPLLVSPVHGTLLDRPALLRVMMARMNANFARLKRIMTARK